MLVDTRPKTAHVLLAFKAKPPFGRRGLMSCVPTCTSSTDWLETATGAVSDEHRPQRRCGDDAAGC